VLGAAGGNVGFAVQATRTAQRSGANRIGESVLAAKGVPVSSNSEAIERQLHFAENDYA
jgi:hypothetical protein